MAEREVTALNETTPALTVVQVGDTYLAPRPVKINSQLANTVAILTLANTAGSIDVFRVDATPEGVVTAGVGSIAYDSNGKPWVKETGAGNTGWVKAGSKEVTSKTAAYTAAAEDIILCDATSGAFSITLPAVASSEHVVYSIKKTDVSANAVTVDGNASETIDGATTTVLAAQYDSVTIACNGSAWHIID